MGSMHVLLLLLPALLCVQGEIKANLKLSPSGDVYEGGNVTFTCTVEVGQGQEAVTLVNWKKRIDNDEVQLDDKTETKIAVNDVVEQIFTNTGRYTASLENTDDYFESNALNRVLTVKLMIKDLTAADIGLIGCDIPDAGLSMDEQLDVISDIDEISLVTFDAAGTEHAVTTDGDEMMFQEGEIRKVHCHVTGAYPAPTVRMFSDGVDVTNLFTKTSVLQASADTKGLQALTYDVWLKNEAFLVDYAYNKKSLECRAEIPNTKLESKSMGLLIKLEGFTPKFNCEKEYYVELHMVDYEVVCRVHAEPAASDFKVFWNEEHEPVVKEGAGANDTDSNDPIGQFDMELEQGETEMETLMTLKINRVYTQHFREYYFEATNELGKSKHTLTLENKATMGQNNVAADVIASTCLLIVTSLVLTFFS